MSAELTLNERAELERLRHENRQLLMEREILSKAATRFPRETHRTRGRIRARSALRIRKSESGHPRDHEDFKRIPK